MLSVFFAECRGVHLLYNKICAKLVGFKEQKTYLVSLKPTNLAPLSPQCKNSRTVGRAIGQNVLDTYAGKQLSQAATDL
jgi:hypothetical protein